MMWMLSKCIHREGDELVSLPAAKVSAASRWLNSSWMSGSGTGMSGNSRRRARRAVAPTVSPVPGDSRATAGWQAIYVDSPETLTPKLALADDRGLAGAGFWAIGYERGLTGYGDLIGRFAAGKLESSP